MKILFLLSRMPYRLEKGDKLRAFHQIKELSKNHEVILFALTSEIGLVQEADAELKKFCRFVYLFPVTKFRNLVSLMQSAGNSKPLQVNYFYHQAAQEKINEIIQTHKPDHIICQLVRMAEYVRFLKHIPKTLDYMDALSKGVRRREKIAPFYLKLVYQLEAERLERYEAAVFHDFQNKIIISEQDRQLIHHPENRQISIIPNGIDTGFFFPVTRPVKYHLVFAGNMSYPPNVDTAVFLVKKVLPLVHKKHPEVKLMLAGATPSQKVVSLQSDKVIVSGWMEDIREAYAAAKIFVAPMAIGTGMQNKVLEAMAMQIPCIISELVNNGIDGTDKENVLLAGTPEEVADKINLLIRDEQLAATLAKRGFEFVNKNYTWQKAVQKLEKLLVSAPKPAEEVIEKRISE